MKGKIIITTILALVIVSALAYAAAVKKQDSESEKYKDWTPYINKDVGFSVMVPKSFVVYEDKIEHPKEHQYGKEIIFASKARPERPGMNIETYVARGGYAIVVNSGENPLGLSLEERLHPNVLENIRKQKNHEIKIAGQKAFIAQRLAGETNILDVDLATKDKYFSIYLIPFVPRKLSDKYPEYKDAVQNLHLMLESFKLIGKSK